MNNTSGLEQASILRCRKRPLIAATSNEVASIVFSKIQQLPPKAGLDEMLSNAIKKLLVIASALCLFGCDASESVPARKADPISILIFNSQQDDLASRKVIEKEFVEFRWGGAKWRIPSASVRDLNRQPSGETNTISIAAAMQQNESGDGIRFESASQSAILDNQFVFVTIHLAAPSHQQPLETLSAHIAYLSKSGASFNWQQYPDSPSQIGGELEKPLLYRPVISVSGMTDSFGGDIFWKCTSSTGYRIEEFISGFAPPKHWLFKESCRMDVRLTNSLRAAVYVPVGSMHDPENVSHAALEFLSRILTTKE